MKGMIFMTNQELREKYIKRLESEKQCYISKMTGIPQSTLTRFKKGYFDLYPHLFIKLQNYLSDNRGDDNDRL